MGEFGKLRIETKTFEKRDIYGSSWDKLYVVKARLMHDESVLETIVKDVTPEGNPIYRTFNAGVVDMGVSSKPTAERDGVLYWISNDALIKLIHTDEQNDDEETIWVVSLDADLEVLEKFGFSPIGAKKAAIVDKVKG